MGRLENAMRRAAGEQAAPAVDLPQPAEDFADDLPNEVAPAVLDPVQAAVEPGYFPNELAPVNGFSGPDEIAAAPPPAAQSAPEMALRSQVNSALSTKTV